MEERYGEVMAREAKVANRRSSVKDAGHRHASMPAARSVEGGGGQEWRRGGRGRRGGEGRGSGWVVPPTPTCMKVGQNDDL